MLAKKERLNRDEFSRFFATGKRYTTEYFQVIYSPYSRFHGSVVVGKKVFKHAVRRNRLRRQIYALLYQERSRRGGGVYIIVVKPPSGTLTKKTLRPAIEKVLALIPSSTP
jgi:ribonuclease P protein component